MFFSQLVGSDLRAGSQSWMHGVAPHMVLSGRLPIVGRGAGVAPSATCCWPMALGRFRLLPSEILKPVRTRSSDLVAFSSHRRPSNAPAAAACSWGHKTPLIWLLALDLRLRSGLHP